MLNLNFILPVSLALSVAFFAQGAMAQGRAAAVGVQAVEEQVFAETVQIFAEVVTARDGAVAGQIAGSVAAVHVLAGDRVQTGDLLIEMDRELLSIRLEQSQAQIAETEAGVRTGGARLTRAQVSFNRVEALRGTSSFSQGRFEDLEAELLEARSQLAEAEAREKTAQTRIAEARYQLDRSRLSLRFQALFLISRQFRGLSFRRARPWRGCWTPVRLKCAPIFPRATPLDYRPGCA